MDQRSPNPYRAAVLLIDVINDFDFADADRLLEYGWPAAQRMKALRDRAAALDLPIIYVNDNFGLWRSTSGDIVDHCLRAKGRDIVALLKPGDQHYFVIKPRFSGFYATTLQALLPYLGAQRLIVGGFATDICVLFTATDAYMRKYALWVPSDCVASADATLSDHALLQMSKTLDAETKPTSDLALADWLSRAPVSF